MLEKFRAFNAVPTVYLCFANECECIDSICMSRNRNVSNGDVFEGTHCDIFFFFVDYAGFYLI